MIDPAESFCDHFGIVPKKSDQDLLVEIGSHFARLPYENITKLIKKHGLPPGPQRRRLPAEVLADHLEFGAGGTCFALTTLFSSVLARFGFDSFPVLCDARHRRDQHCALVTPINDVLHLIDPGYLLTTPVPLIPGQHGHVEIRCLGNNRVFDLSTYGVHRYRFRAQPVQPQRFLAIWDQSFDWTMMNGVHLSAQLEDGYAYVHNLKMRLTMKDGKENHNIRGRESEALATHFGISDVLVRRGYDLLASLRDKRND